MKKNIESKSEKFKLSGSGKSIASLPVDKLQESWAKLYPLIEHWQSDMKFFEDELRFLHMLIDKYFVGLIKERNISKTRALANKLYEMEPRRKNLSVQLGAHLLHLQELIENPFSHDVHAFNKEHIEMEKEMIQFVYGFRAVKSEAFRAIEQVIAEDAKKRIL